MNEPTPFQHDVRLMLSELLAAVDRGEVLSVAVCWSTLAGSASYNWRNVAGIPGCDQLGDAVGALAGSIQQKRDEAVQQAESTAKEFPPTHAYYGRPEDEDSIEIVTLN